MSVTIVRFPTRQHVGAAKAAGFVYEGHRTGVFVHRNNPTWCAKMLANGELAVNSGGLIPFLRPHEINLNAVVQAYGSVMAYLLENGLATDPSQPVIGVFFAGGPAPSGNAVIKQLVLGSHNSSAIVVSFKDGCNGLLTGDAVVLTRDLVKTTQRMPGSNIGTARTNPNQEQRQAIKDSLRHWGISGLVAIGGDDTLTTANRLHKIGIPVVGVPKTIDNDVPLTDICFGHETVVNASAKQLVNLLIDGMNRNAWYVVQVMGRKSGSWTMRAAKAAAATSFYIPEMFSKKGILELLTLKDQKPEVNKLLADIASVVRIDGQAVSSIDDLSSKLRSVTSEDQIMIDFELFLSLIKTLVASRKKNGESYGVITIAEGLMYKIPTRTIETSPDLKPRRGVLEGMGAVFEYDQHANPRISKLRFADFIANRLTEDKTAQTEAMYFGYQFRCEGDIVGFDINLSTDFGNGAANAMLGGKSGNMVATQNGQTVLVPFDSLPLDETGHIIPRVVGLNESVFLSALSIAYNKSIEN